MYVPLLYPSHYWTYFLIFFRETIRQWNWGMLVAPLRDSDPKASVVETSPHMLSSF